MMNPVPWLQMTNMISYQGLVRTFLKRLNEMEIYPGVTFSEELEGQLFASIMLDMEKLISAYRRMLRQGNHALTVIVG